MNNDEILRKAEAGEGLTVDEIKVYQKLVKLEIHTYGKYGNLAKEYLEKHNFGKYLMIENIPEYLHGIDRAAERMYDAMYAKLIALPKYKKNGDFMHNFQVETEIQHIIEEEILNEIVYA